MCAGEALEPVEGKQSLTASPLWLTGPETRSVVLSSLCDTLFFIFYLILSATKINFLPLIEQTLKKLLASQRQKLMLDCS